MISEKYIQSYREDKTGKFNIKYVAPKPFAVAYQADGDGGASFRSEEGDARGSYGYRDDQGLYRLVENSAGQGGFQAAVKTNEPVVDGKENPADIIMNVQQAPEAIQDKYTRVFTGFGEALYFK
ncbi:uncharacterized protein CDAR_375901 [Caerostris darwini]|uniref:Uncharacterized protein n=1 Tax=Caerostris darwini TaxID=1538125 RepID=A0AAV4SAT0_9ARAC|nr:uncharacterized protein CDAR_375901 [Caerostris darwini]